MATSLVLSFGLVSLLLVITPGADWAYTISAGIRWQSPIPAVMGILSGHLLATIIVAVGVGVWISRFPIVISAITVAGALYLVWLGTGMVRKPASIESNNDVGAQTIHGQYLGGFAVTAMNPKVFLLFLALLPQFIDVQSRWPVSAQMFTLGSVHVVICAVVYSAIAILAMRLLRSRPSASFMVSRVSGVALVIIGIGLIVEQVL